MPAIVHRAGIPGGAGIAAGGAALLWTEPAASPLPAGSPMPASDYALLISLDVLALSGLATLATHTTPAFGPVLLTHLVAIAFTFTAAPLQRVPPLHLPFPRTRPRQPGDLGC